MGQAGSPRADRGHLLLTALSSLSFLFLLFLLQSNFTASLLPAVGPEAGAASLEPAEGCSFPIARPCPLPPRFSGCPPPPPPRFPLRPRTRARSTTRQPPPRCSAPVPAAHTGRAGCQHPPPPPTPTAARGPHRLSLLASSCPFQHSMMSMFSTINPPALLSSQKAHLLPALRSRVRGQPQGRSRAPRHLCPGRLPPSSKHPEPAPERPTGTDRTL